MSEGGSGHVGNILWYTLRKKIVLATEISLTTNVFPIHHTIKYYTYSLQLFKMFRRNR